MSPTFKFAVKFFIGWFFLVSGLFLAHFALQPLFWPQLGRLLLGFGVVIAVLMTIMGFMATCCWIMSRFRLFDDEYWY